MTSYSDQRSALDAEIIIDIEMFVVNPLKVYMKIYKLNKLN